MKYLLLLIAGFLALDFFGAFTHVFELDYYKNFHYPLDGDCVKWADQLRRGMTPDVSPINSYNHTFLYSANHKCQDADFDLNPRLVYIIKSSLENFKRRNAIRTSWGNENRFSDIVIRTVFVLGVPDSKDARGGHTQSLIDIEANHYNDIVQADFVDAYFNNTIKTMTGLRWAVEHCPRSRFYMFVDDDYYVSTKNVLRFVRNPVHYPEYLEEADETIRQLARKLTEMENKSDEDVIKLEEEIQEVLGQHGVGPGHSLDSRKHLHVIRTRYDELRKTKRTLKWNDSAEPQVDNGNNKSRVARELLDLDLPLDVKLFSGFVINSAPHRHKTSKWHISLDEYPYHMWPSYVSAGGYILSREALIQMYFVSKFTKHFRFDDIYLAIVAIKALIEPLHSEEFHFQKAPYSGPQSYRYVIASHGYDDPEEMVKVWSQVRAAGSA